MVFFLAFRNIVKNRKNSVIIALLIAVITFLFFIGNSVLGRTEQNIRETYVENITGEVVLQKTGDITMNLFGANTPVIDVYFTIPVLPAYDVVMDLVAAETGIAKLTSQVSSKAYLDLSGVREPVLLCGVDSATYFSLFPGITVEEGRFLHPGEYGAMITSQRAERIARQSGERPAIGAPMLLTAGGRLGFKIREVPLVGIYHYQNPGQFMNEIIIIDPQTARVLNSIQVASVADADVGGEALNLLTSDLDDIFGEEDLSGADEPEKAEFSVDMLHTFLQDSETEGQESGGEWNFIILRLEKGVSPALFISSLNNKIRSYGVTAVNWRIAAGTSAIILLLIQALFNGGVFLVSVAGIIAVINILLIAVFRRTREIGTLRAIGASDSYIRFLILGENLIIALAAGIAGVLGGLWFCRMINQMGIVIPNEFIASLMGGAVLKIEHFPHIAGFSLVVAVVLGIAASVYPVEIAVRIEPMTAVRKG